MARELGGAELAGVLDRWEASGATWRVEPRDAASLTIVLCACTGEPVERVLAVGEEAREAVARRVSSRGPGG